MGYYVAPLSLFILYFILRVIFISPLCAKCCSNCEFPPRVIKRSFLVDWKSNRIKQSSSL